MFPKFQIGILCSASPVTHAPAKGALVVKYFLGVQLQQHRLLHVACCQRQCCSSYFSGATLSPSKRRVFCFLDHRLSRFVTICCWIIFVFFLALFYLFLLLFLFATAAFVCCLLPAFVVCISMSLWGLCVNICHFIASIFIGMGASHEF